MRRRNDDELFTLIDAHAGTLLHWTLLDLALREAASELRFVQTLERLLQQYVVVRAAAEPGSSELTTRAVCCAAWHRNWRAVEVLYMHATRVEPRLLPDCMRATTTTSSATSATPSLHKSIRNDLESYTKFVVAPLKGFELQKEKRPMARQNYWLDYVVRNGTPAELDSMIAKLNRMYATQLLQGAESTATLAPNDMLIAVLRRYLADAAPAPTPTPTPTPVAGVAAAATKGRTVASPSIYRTLPAWSPAVLRP